MRERLRPLIKTECQFLFMSHLLGPFLQRFQTERTRCLLDVSNCQDGDITGFIVFVFFLFNNYFIFMTTFLYFAADNGIV